MRFDSRQDAGRQLGQRLRDLAVEADLVAGLPRGGVVVAAEVAAILHRPLTVLIVRKIGHPWHREFAVGALAEEGVLILDRKAMASLPLAGVELERVIREEKNRLRQYILKFQTDHPADFSGRRVLVVDDGLATGATAEAAVNAARRKHARQVIIAVPVVSTSAGQRLARVADDVIALVTDEDFEAVGQYYRRFFQTSDEEVLAILHRQPAAYGPDHGQTPGKPGNG
jgi:putative phosphoribosyl transferase